MDRMNMRSAMAYWKLSAVVVAFVGVTSYLSVRAHECDKLPRKQVLKYTELLREAARASIQSSQDQHPVQKFIDSSKAMCAINVVREFLTPYQAKHILNIDMDEMSEFISKQHEDSTALLLKSCAS
jgi:hypothetical protein